MKFLVIGGSGMLGTDLVAELTKRGHSVESPSSKDLNITDPCSVAQIAVEPGKYDWAINCAAYTAVDKAETEVQAATELNALGPAYLGNACNVAGIKVLHVSTDFVFDGTASTPYSESAETHPLGVYGSTKREGELGLLAANPNVLIVRTSWLYGIHGNSFPRTMIRAWEAGKELKVVADQVGCPTSTVDLARVLVDLCEKNGYPGIYHASGPNATTWHAFAIEAIQAWKEFTRSDRAVQIAPIPTEAYPTPAKRPKYSVMSMDNLASLGIAPMRPMKESIQEFVGRLKL